MPGEDLQQRRLAGAVLADQGVRLPVGRSKADAAKRVHGAKRLAHVEKVEAVVIGRVILLRVSANLAAVSAYSLGNPSIGR